MADASEVTNVEMTRFTDRINLSRERHVRVKYEAKVSCRGADRDGGVTKSESREIGEFETLLLGTNEHEFSFRRIQKEFVMIHPGCYVIKSRG